MTDTDQRGKAATPSDIREIAGAVDDGVIASIAALGATRDEVLEAYAWLTSDDYLHRELHHSLHGRVAQVFEILEAQLPNSDQ